MRLEEEGMGLVRCVACHAVYQQELVLTPLDGGVGCPHCGSSAWLAVQVPVEETAAPVLA